MKALLKLLSVSIRFLFTVTLVISPLVLSACGGKEPHITSHYNRGVEYLQKGLYYHAASEFEEALKKTPDNRKAAYNLALAMQMSGKSKEAEERYRSLYAETKDVNALVNLITLLQQEGKQQLARKLLQQGRKDHPKESFLALIEGNMFTETYKVSHSTEDLQKAETAFQQAIQLNPERAEPYFRLALLSREVGREDSTAYHNALKALSIHTKLGFQSKTWPEDFNKHEYDHNLLRYLMLLAEIEEETGRFIDAAKHLEQAIAQNISLKEIQNRYDSLHRSPLLRIGKLYFSLKRYRTALRYLEANKRYMPDDKETDALLRACYKKLASDPESRHKKKHSELISHRQAD